MRACHFIGRSLHVLIGSSGFPNHQQSRSDIPGVEVELPKPVQAATRYRAQVQRADPARLTPWVNMHTWWKK